MRERVKLTNHHGQYFREISGDVMKIVIGYDGTAVADESLEDLIYAGLPADTMAIILTVKGGWLLDRAEREIAEIAEKGREKLSAIFPKWQVKAETSFGNPATQILQVAEGFSPDLIVLGERKNSGEGRNLFLGSVANEVISNATGSVRICRQESDMRSLLNIVGFDGSEPASRAVKALAAREWPKNSEVRLVVVADSTVIDTVGRFIPQIANATIESRAVHQWADALCKEPISFLKRHGINAVLHLEFGNPKDVITTLAEKWNAATIFMGPHCAGNSYERFLLGSVSAAVAARANCSIEIIR